MSNHSPIRLLLVDDQEMYREGFRMVLSTRPEFEVVGDAEDGMAAINLLRTVKADVVLMDVRMPRMDGVEATRRIREAGGPPVLVLTTFDLDEHAYDAIRAGASGFLLKDAPLDELVTAIRHVHDGDAVVAPSTTRRLLDRFAALRPEEAPQRDAGELDVLTDREREVLSLIAQGLSNGEIAEELVIAESTTRVHVGRILAKLRLRDRAQAVVMAYQVGLVGHDRTSEGERSQASSSPSQYRSDERR
ncbi:MULTISPECIES: response regulator transcription factor [unclassified Brevibacterium]|uniref:response regulator n=1 Tax=unclassified Brevibacterium TaxID=2614124 RepID=UPI0009F2A7D2|nr:MULTISPECIES: response regulator transcription factor [unclassified Brevibacterium]